MRDRIADIIVEDVEWHTENGAPWRGMQAADAIIEALPEMIPDLVWEDNGQDELATTNGYTIASDRKNEFVMFPPVGDGTVFLVEKKAKAAANAHHKAAIMAAFGVTS